MATFFKYCLEFITAFWHNFALMAPSLLFGFFMAGVFSVFLSPDFVKRHVGKKGIVSIIKAALLGVPLPLCSCGVLPVALSLRKQGMSKGSAAGFLISTPQTGVDSIVVTWSLLGWIFALFRAVAAFFAGLFGGVMVERLGEPDTVTEDDHPVPECCESGDCSDARAEPCCDNDDCESHKKNLPFRKKIVKIFHYGFIVLLGDIATALVIGIILAAIIGMVIPDGFFERYIGSGIWTMLVMLAFGIPLYVCATASTPIALALVLKGVSPGAALVFLMSGPATNAASVSAIWKILGKRSTVIYLLSIAVTALASGYLLDFIYVEAFNGGQMRQIHQHSKHLAVWQHLSAVILAMLLVYNYLKKYLIIKPEAGTDVTGDTGVTKFKVAGMTCSHCRDAVIESIREIPEIISVDLDLNTGNCIITYPPEVEIDQESLAKQVEKAGYKAVF